jgi:hypothetical protein
LHLLLLRNAFLRNLSPPNIQGQQRVTQKTIDGSHPTSFPNEF